MTIATKTVSYQYVAGNRSLMIDPQGGRTTYVYDSLNQISSLINPQGERTSFTYDANGRQTLTKLTNGSRASFTYDAASNLTTLANLKSDNSVVSQFNYQYDKVGKRTTTVEADSSRTTWLYDNIYQLTEEHRTGSNPYQNLYSYDAAGNRLIKKLDSARTTYTYDTANQLQNSIDAGGATTYTYDANGNQQLTHTPTGDRTTTTWDYENKNTIVELPGSIRNSFAYAPGGLRIKLDDSMGTKKFVWDNQSYLAEADANNDIQVTYTNRIQPYGNLISKRQNNSTSYYHYDALGSTRELSNSTGAVTDAYLYDAWGNLVSSTGTTVNPFRWTGNVGYYWDDETKNYYVRARTYQPKIGRWLSTDPLRFTDGMNLFKAYFVPNNVDPSGMSGRKLQECERCLLIKILSPVLGISLIESFVISLATRIFDESIPSGSSDLELFAQLAYLGGGEAVTLGNEIHFKGSSQACGKLKCPPYCCNNKTLQNEAGVDSTSNLAILGHELVHINQNLNTAKNEQNFYEQYLQEYLSLRARGADHDKAYRCISYEIEAYAIEHALKAFFAKDDNKKIFEEACCREKSIPQTLINSIAISYRMEVFFESLSCYRQFPPIK